MVGSGKMSIDQHIIGMKAYLARMQSICKFLEIRFTVNPTLWFWRNRMRANKLMLRGAAVLNQPTTGESDNFKIGPLIKKWASGTQQKHMIVRKICEMAIDGRRAISASEVHMELQGRSQATASLDRIRSAFSHAVEMGLFRKAKSGHGDLYTITKICLIELSERTHCKYTNNDFLEMCRFAVAYDEMRKQAEATGEDEKMGKVYESDHQTLVERIFFGDEGRID